MLNLHYTLLLLIPPISTPYPATSLTFTLHFATINTEIKCLLIYSLKKFTLHFATINTKLKENRFAIFIVFTLHFATINTGYTDNRTTGVG